MLHLSVMKDYDTDGMGCNTRDLYIKKDPSKPLFDLAVKAAPLTSSLCRQNPLELLSPVSSDSTSRASHRQGAEYSPWVSCLTSLETTVIASNTSHIELCTHAPHAILYIFLFASIGSTARSHHPSPTPGPSQSSPTMPPGTPSSLRNRSSRQTHTPLTTHVPRC